MKGVEWTSDDLCKAHNGKQMKALVGISDGTNGLQMYLDCAGANLQTAKQAPRQAHAQYNKAASVASVYSVQRTRTSCYTNVNFM